jgi:hypothetical protein
MLQAGACPVAAGKFEVQMRERFQPKRQQILPEKPIPSDNGEKRVGLKDARLHLSQFGNGSELKKGPTYRFLIRNNYLLLVVSEANWPNVSTKNAESTTFIENRGLRVSICPRSAAWLARAARIHGKPC